MSAPNIEEIDWAIGILEKEESSFSVYAKLASLYTCRNEIQKRSHYNIPHRKYSWAADPDESEKSYSEAKSESETTKFHAIMNEQIAEEWTQSMDNADGTKGAHWSIEQTKKLMEQKKELQEFDLPDVFAVINMMYSDYVEVAKKLNVNVIDFYVSMTIAWLKDTDASAGKDKTAVYYEHVVK